MAVTHPGEVAIPVPAPQAPSRRRRVLVAGIGLVGVPLVLAAAAVGTWVGYELAHEGKVFEGIAIGGVDVSGKTPSEAAALVSASLGSRFDGTVTVESEAGTASISYAELGRSTDVDASVAAAMDVGRAGSLLQRLEWRVWSLTNGTSVEPRLAHDPSALDAWIGSLGERWDVAPTPAGLVWARRGMTLIGDEPGRQLARTDLRSQLAPILADPAADPETVVRGLLPRTESEYDDVDLKMTATALRRLARPVELTLGKESWTIKGGKVRSWIHLVPSRSGPVPALDPEAVAASLPKGLKDAARRKPVETVFLTTRGGDRIGFVSGTPGRRLDTDKTVAAIMGTLALRQAGDLAPSTIKAKTTRVALELTPEEAGKVVPEMVRIGTWTTYYAVSERNGFGANITIPAQLINKTLVRPGAVFDFWGAIGPVTYERGFRDGAIIVGGRSQPTGAIAGGICSASTTLFNAAARAGLQIVERDNHYYYIDRYPLGLDATVSKSRGRIVQNMRFRNDTRHDIFITGSAGPGWVRFDIYSVPNGREVSFSTPKVWNVVPARDIVVKTSSLPRGTSVREEYPVQGMQVLVTRTVRENGRVIHRDDFYTNYGKVDGILKVGTG